MYKLEVTEEIFTQATGYKPEDDDLERCNCPLAGSRLHELCGWDERRGMPNFMLGESRRNKHLADK